MKHVRRFWDLKQMVLVITLSVYLLIYQINNMPHFMLLDLLKQHCRLTKTMLTEFFKFNLDIQQSIQNGVAPQNLFTYCEIPEHYASSENNQVFVGLCHPEV
jgi:hypothetical protein